jgi:hypothetical protein
VVDRCFPLERADYGTSRNDVKPSRTPGCRIGHTFGTSAARSRRSEARFVLIGLRLTGRDEQRRRTGGAGDG